MKWHSRRRPNSLKAGFRVSTDAGEVILVDVQHHVVQALHREREVEHELRCFRAVALAAGVRLANRDAEEGSAVAMVNLVETGIADGTLGGLLA